MGYGLCSLPLRSAQHLLQFVYNSEVEAIVMAALRVLGIPALLCLLASCATHNSPNRLAAAPKSGPRASIYATYTGGMLNRQADAVFRVDQAAYTMVAHLGGDGLIEVLHPTDARESGRVPGGKWFRTESFVAYYDAVPELYSFAVTRYRSAGAQFDSYDGRGHGFIFLIASRHPLHFDRISQFGLWNEFEAVNYRISADPRLAIKEFADIIAGDREYTLQFARSSGTTAMTSYVDDAFDCSYLTSLGLGMSGTPWSYIYLPYSALTGMRGGGCRNRYALGQYAWGQYYYSSGGFFTPRPTTPGAPTPQNPPGGGALGFRRPGLRPTGQSGPALGLNRPMRGGAPGTTTAPVYAPPDRGRSLGPRSTDFGDRSSTPTRTYEPRRESPTHEAPRSFTPREAPVERAQPVREAPRAAPQREAPAPVQREVARPNPEQRKPPEDRKP